MCWGEREKDTKKKQKQKKKQQQHVQSIVEWRVGRFEMFVHCATLVRLSLAETTDAVVLRILVLYLFIISQPIWLHYTFPDPGTMSAFFFFFFDSTIVTICNSTVCQLKFQNEFMRNFSQFTQFVLISRIGTRWIWSLVFQMNATMCLCSPSLSYGTSQYPPLTNQFMGWAIFHIILNSIPLNV